MRKYLLSETGNFYKTNLHCHTTYSDGSYTPEQVKEIYKEHGYSAVAFTDHDIFIAHDDLTDDTFVALHGFEMEINQPKKAAFEHIKTCHICFVGIDPDNMIQPCYHRSDYLFGRAPSHRGEIKYDENEPDFIRSYDAECISKIMNTAREKGFFVTYNHPAWSMEDYGDYMGYNGMHAMEIYNGGCFAEGYEDYNSRDYDNLLRGGKRIYCIGADDNHNHRARDDRHFDTGVAWTMIKAEELNYRALTDSLVKGNFYASMGPEIYELYHENGRVNIKCSDADRIYITFGIRRGEVYYSREDGVINGASFSVPEDCGYFRLTVVDKKGRTACTNAYFMEDVLA